MKLTLDRFFWAAGMVLFFAHLFYILNYGVNIPFMDEWEALRPGRLEREINWSWIFAFHNEHRIVPTKLMTWALYRVSSWNVVSQLFLNFLLYFGLCALLLKNFGKLFKVPTGFLFCLFASTVAHENHMWAFQSQFHFFLLFFVSSLLSLRSNTVLRYFTAPFALLSAFSFSSGVVCALFVGLLCLLLAPMEKERRKFNFISAAVIFIGLGFWFVGYQKNPGHPPLVMPWKEEFWNHYLNLLSVGFGFTELTTIPGLFIVLFLLSCSMYLTWQCLFSADLQARRDFAALLFLGFGIGAALAAVSLARAGFGPGQAKSSRYAEISAILILPIWICFWFAILKVRSFVDSAEFRFAYFKKSPLFLTVLLGLSAFLPLADKFRWKRTYAQMHEHRLEGQACVQSYYVSLGDGFCPQIYPAPIAEQLQQAAKLKVLFAEKAL